MATYGKGYTSYRTKGTFVPEMDPARVAKEILGACCCHEAYTTRKMIDPDCVWHKYAGEIEDALTAFAAQQVKEARRQVWIEAARYLDGFDAITCKHEFRRRAHDESR